MKAFTPSTRRAGGGLIVVHALS